MQVRIMIRKTWPTFCGDDLHMEGRCGYEYGSHTNPSLHSDCYQMLIYQTFLKLKFKNLEKKINKRKKYLKRLLLQYYFQLLPLVNLKILLYGELFEDVTLIIYSRRALRTTIGEENIQHWFEGGSIKQEEGNHCQLSRDWKKLCSLKSYQPVLKFFDN